ncbi:progranulin-like isoform X2 [Babylonia areolata]|uniref:progranulin-like isoform X2 n=1 Tax=Babylonia areolata TaxID=304850 RepID=UPI003FD3688F
MKTVLLALSALAIARLAAGAVKCDATHDCPTGSTCCMTSSGQWGCCPLPKAVCCADHLHCCPNGFKCHTSTGQCEKGSVTLPWLKKSPAHVRRSNAEAVSPLVWKSEKVQVESVRCDATHDCPTGSTCCKTSSGWGCCPLPQAVCCQDGVHCCPNGYSCHVSTGQCEKGSITLPWLQKSPARVKDGPLKQMESVMCNATRSCPTGNTCCWTPSGWGCCPLPQAVCCQDGVHCCPNGYTCDVSSGKCNKGSIALPWLQKSPAFVKAGPQKKVKSVRCDATHDCPTATTCCKTPSGWGCCPLPQAVCCQDGVHCCPNGYTCHVSTGQCEKGSITLPWLQKSPAHVKAGPLKKMESVRCDATHDCPTATTCCKTPSGWGCCPLPQAVCCQDGVHCCPNGYTCHVSTGQCEKGSITLPWLQKSPARVKDGPLKQMESVMCNATRSCPTGNTCCWTPSGWGCCPLPQAVCCQDGVHCCPNGYTCDVSSGKCNKGSIALPWLQKSPAFVKAGPQKKVESVRCDATHDCPTATTCCKTPSGWGCCPLPQAVCCQDGVHCCPNGYTCHVSTGQCEKGSITLPWLQKSPSLFRP